MYAARTLLRSKGVLFLDPVLENRSSHEYLFYGLLGQSAFPWADAKTIRAMKRKLTSVRSAIDAWPGTAVISAEALATSRLQDIAQISEYLKGLEVEIVMTARAITNVIPSFWQQHVKNGRLTAFHDFLSSIERERIELTSPEWNHSDSHNWWRAFAYDRLVSRWQSHFNTIHFITVPNSSKSRVNLWDRWQKLEAFGDSLSEIPYELPRERENRALTALQVELLRSLLIQVKNNGGSEASAKAVRRYLLDTVFPAVTEDKSRVQLSRFWHQKFTEYAEQDLPNVSQVNLVGDLDDLTLEYQDGETQTQDEIAMTLATYLKIASEIEPKASRKRLWKP
jgi:hypothetical protein